MLCLQRCPSVIFSLSRLDEHMCCTSALKILLIKHGGVQLFAGEVKASLSSAASLDACLYPLLTIGTVCQKQPRKDCRRGPWDVFLSVNAHTHPLPVHQKTVCSTWTRPLGNHVSYIHTTVSFPRFPPTRTHNKASLAHDSGLLRNQRLDGFNPGSFM